MRRLMAGLLALLPVLLLSACGPAPHQVDLTADVNAELPAAPPPEPGVYYFGFDRRLEPAEDVRIYVPFLRYLENVTGYRFQLKPSPRGGSVVDELGNGSLQFAAIGALSYVEAHQRFGVKALAEARTPDGNAQYRALIVTRPDSRVRTLGDLKGGSFAFGNQTSTQGNLIPRIMLQQAGIALTDLGSFQYHTSHVETANAVMSGRFDAGAIQDTLGRELVRQGLLRIVAESDPFPSSTISASPTVPDQVLKAVTKALLDFAPTGRDAAGLYHWEQSEMPLGFVPVDGEALARVERLAEEVGLLKQGDRP
ncbi:MAG: phosphate/phosphite/phosphonate ABC transporter substrate-binding protein [Firmicutes bacterium]|nr:phosphate/phosphite/phosphonate ABC transporter substrate-binding protein [Bacillota bacterium]